MSRGIFTLSEIAQEFNADFLDPDTCRHWILTKLHPTGAFCPKCNEPLLPKHLNRFWSGERVKCHNCQKFFTALTDTFLSGMQFNFSEIVLLAMLLSLGISDKSIAEFLKISPANVWIWRQKFQAMDRTRSLVNNTL